MNECDEINFIISVTFLTVLTVRQSRQEVTVHLRHRLREFGEKHSLFLINISNLKVRGRT